jgi:PD-(D/E)XK nuclease superfamily
MTYSYTQISQYLSCPRRYKHRYLDGWKEKDTRAAMLFGRAFEQAVGAYFQRLDAAAVLYREWSAHQDSGLQYSERDSWDRMLQSGVQLLDRFAQDDRVSIRQPRRNLQVKFNRPLGGQNDFVAYVDAIGELDGTRCLLEWKTTASRYPEEPTGLLALDPQLVCYSWVTGIADVAQVVFVRK